MFLFFIYKLNISKSCFILLLFASKSFKIDVIVLNTYAKIHDENNVKQILTETSYGFIGVISPYPTVVIVVIAKYNPFKYISSQSEFYNSL